MLAQPDKCHREYCIEETNSYATYEGDEAGEYCYTQDFSHEARRDAHETSHDPNNVDLASASQCVALWVGSVSGFLSQPRGYWIGRHQNLGRRMQDARGKAKSAAR